MLSLVEPLIKQKWAWQITWLSHTQNMSVIFVDSFRGKEPVCASLFLQKTGINLFIIKTVKKCWYSWLFSGIDSLKTAKIFSLKIFWKHVVNWSHLINNFGQPSIAWLCSHQIPEPLIKQKWRKLLHFFLVPIPHLFALENCFQGKGRTREDYRCIRRHS